MFEFLKQFFSTRNEEKSSGFLATMLDDVSGIWTPKNDKRTLIKEGFIGNVVVYWCIIRIANAISAVPHELRGRGGQIVSESHPISKVLRTPAQNTDLPQFIEQLVIQLLTTGDAYVQRILNDSGKLLELNVLDPDSARYIPNQMGGFSAIELQFGASRVHFPISDNGESDLLHIKLPNPANWQFGLSPIRVAGLLIDQMNEAVKWNYGILNSGVVLRGVLKVDSILSEGDADRYRDAFARAYAADKQLKIAVFGKGVEYQQLTDSSLQNLLVDEQIERLARYICLAFGVPAYLLGLKDGATFSNVTEARQFFYDNTVIPLTERIFSALSVWLSQLTANRIEIVPLWQQVPVLAERQRQTWEKLDAISFLSLNEKRELAGFQPFDGGDFVAQPPNLVPVGEVPRED